MFKEVHISVTWRYRSGFVLLQSSLCCSERKRGAAHSPAEKRHRRGLHPESRKKVFRKFPYCGQQDVCGF